MSNVSEFIGLLRSQVKRGIYVWGANGENVTAMTDPAAWIRKREARHPQDMERNIQRDLALFAERKAAGVDPILAFDCSGLMYWAGKQVGVFKSDLAARHIFAMCRAVSKDDPKPGDFLFEGSASDITHVGMYIGDGKLIECEGRDVGVVENAYKSSKWYAAGRLDALSPDKPQTEPTCHKVRVKGGSVRVRQGASADTPKLFTAHRGEVYDLLGIADTGWYHIETERGEGYISNRADLTEVIA